MPVLMPDPTINVKRKFSPQTLQVLQHFLKAPNSELYGYELLKRTQLSNATLYGILNRLADQGVLQSEWRGLDSDGKSGKSGRPFRVYQLTEAGKDYVLGELAERLAERQSATSRAAKATGKSGRNVRGSTKKVGA